MKKLRTLIAVLAIFALPIIVNAQENNEIPSYRQKGYAGSVSVSDMFIFFAGFDTSHGYMFNEHHYLGGGVEIYVLTPFLPTELVSFIEPFVEYKAYFLKRRSTPTASLRGGYSIGSSINYSGKGDIKTPSVLCQFALNPSLGWDVGLKCGKGLGLSVGLMLLTDMSEINYAPEISFGFRF